MPPGSVSVEEEGVILDNVLLVDRGTFCEADMRALLASGPWPARNIDQNIADLTAQIAACARGSQELLRISNNYGAATVAAYMGHVQDQAESAVRRLIGRLSDGHFTYAMDNGAIVQVTVQLDQGTGSATVDFTGSSAQLSGNFGVAMGTNDYLTCKWYLHIKFLEIFHTFESKNVFGIEFRLILVVFYCQPCS